MSDGDKYVNGELFLRIETVADVFHVESVVLREAYSSGLLGHGIEEGPTILIAAVELDRVATVVRMHAVLGYDLEMVELALSRLSV